MRTLIFLLTLSVTAQAADTTRLCAYNLLKYSASNEDGRVPKFATVLNEIRPDILVCSEVDDATMGPRFIADVLTYAPFAASPFIDGPDTDIQILYDQTKFTLLGQTRIRTELRDIAEFTLLHKPTNGLTADTLVVYGMHLKASDGFQEQRGREVDSLLKHITNRTYMVACGDLNLYSPQEPAYTKLSAHPFIDPLGANWQRNNSTFARLYTQCTRKDQVAACGGGVSGGLDDRFDFIFLTPTLHDRFVDGSYTAYGNDGVARLNSSIIDPPNTLVSQAMAEALHCASDHLPVYVDFVLGDVQAGVDPSLVQAYAVHYDGSRIVVSGCTIGAALTVHDINGHLLKTVSVSEPTMFIDTASLPSGFYIVSQLFSSAGVSVVH